MPARLKSLKIVAPALAGLLILSAVLSPRAPTMSLASDLGMTEEDLCDMLAQSGSLAVARLDAAGFPHATNKEREVYRLVQDGTVEAVLHIDWGAQAAECLPLDYAGLVDADVRMTPKAYAALVGELKHVIGTGELSGGLLTRPGNLVSIWWGTDIVLAGSAASGSAYERSVALWAAGWLADNGGA